MECILIAAMQCTLIYLGGDFLQQFYRQYMDPTLLDRAESIQERGQRMQKQAKYKQALDAYQQLLQINKNAYGEGSEEYEKTSIKICQLCNLISMILLQKQKFDLCLVFLRKAQAHCSRNAKYTAITFNNYACYCRKTGKLRTALSHLQNALQLQWKAKKEDTLADTYLNLCAVLSQLGKHKQALENVLFSITILQEEILGKEEVNIERIPVLAIAYHNMGVQLEHLQRYEESISTYEKAVKFAEKHLHQNNGLVENLRTVLSNAKEARMTNEKKEKKMVVPREGSREKDKSVKMKSLYGQRPQTAGKKSVAGKR